MANPTSVEAAIISQNGNAYDDGFVPDFWAPIWRYAADRSDETEAEPCAALGRLMPSEWQYKHGVPDPDHSRPRTLGTMTSRWSQRPGVDQGTARTFRRLLKRIVASTRPSISTSATDRCPLLALWGRERRDLRRPSRATAFTRYMPEAQLELLDGGHFLLESNIEDAVRIIREWRASF